jgi:hypothetical protein
VSPEYRSGKENFDFNIQGDIAQKVLTIMKLRREPYRNYLRRKSTQSATRRVITTMSTTNQTEKMTMAQTDAQTEAFIAEMRRAYAAGILPEWQKERLEKIPGWTWEPNVAPVATAPRKMPGIRKLRPRAGNKSPR